MTTTTRAAFPNDVTLEAIESLLGQINSLVIDASRNGMRETWGNLNDAASALYLAKRTVRCERQTVTGGAA